MKAGPYLKTKRAKEMPGKSVKVGGTVVIKKKGAKPLGFKKGGLHESLGVPQDEPIPQKKKEAAMAGKYGKLAEKQADFAFKGALAKGRETVAKDNARQKAAKKMKVYTNDSM